MNEARRQAGFVETNGTKLYYEMQGQGRPLVLLHGGYMDGRMWDDQFDVFAHEYQVIRYDSRGFGRSAMPQIPYSSAEDLTALLDCLNVEHATLLGLSLGGMIALDFTLTHPDRVDALILVGAAVGGFVPSLTEEAKEKHRQRDALFVKAAEEHNVPQLRELVMQHPTLVPSSKYPEARQHVRENLSKYSFVFVTDPAPQRELTPPATERLSEIHVPTLIIVGEEDDNVLHQMADLLEHDIPHARRAGIKETMHMPNIEKPAEFNQLVLGFLREL
jgi:3-oxoadipate enol-lactonase